MDKKIIVTVFRSGGADFDGVWVEHWRVGKTIRELYLNQGFSFIVEPACSLVSYNHVNRIKKLLGM